MGAARSSFADVTFAYAGGPEGLRPLLAAIPAGQKVGLVGPSGAGKTTLASLRATARGRAGWQVRVDGQPSPPSLRSPCAPRSRSCRRKSRCSTARSSRTSATAAPKRPTRRSSPRPGPPTATSSSASLPAGYDTLVGERGHQALGWPAPAARHRARDPEGRPDPDSRRGDLGARSESETAGPERARHADAGPHRARDRAPPLHALCTGPHRRARPGPDRRGRQPSRTPPRGGLFEALWRMQADSFTLDVPTADAA